jgi:MFS family permease
MLIRTQQKQIPWIWAFLIGMPWVTSGFADRTSSEPMTLTLRKFVEDPALLSFLSSINILFNFMVGVTACYLSDRIWTRFGRRSPFLIASSLGCAFTLFVLPLAGSFWMVVLCVVAYQFFVDLNKVWEPLFNEVIPSAQRGRAGIFRMLLVNGGLLLYAKFLMGRWDKSYDLGLPTGPVTGEQALYWVVALVFLANASFIALRVREEFPEPAPGEAPSSYRPSRIPGVTVLVGEESAPRSGLARVAGFFQDMFGSAQKRWVYFLYACPIIAGIAVSHPSVLLMQREQIGLTMEEYSDIVAISQLCMLVVFAPAAGFLADYIPRLWQMRLGLLLPGTIQLGFFLYLRFAGNFEADYTTVLVVQVATAAGLSLLYAVWGPLVYDYIAANKMGAFQAGINFTAGLLAFGLTNIGGLWVRLWTAVLGRGGEGSAFDHSSILLLWFILGLGATLLTFLFSRAERRGHVRAEGRIEHRQSPV